MKSKYAVVNSDGITVATFETYKDAFVYSQVNGDSTWQIKPVF